MLVLEHAHLPELLAAVLPDRVVKAVGPAPVLPDPEDGVPLPLQVVVLLLGPDHLLDREDLVHGVGVVDLADLVPEEDALLLGPVGQVLDLDYPLLHEGDVLLGGLVLALELPDGVPDHPLLLEHLLKIIEAAVGLQAALDKTELNFVDFLDGLEFLLLRKALRLGEHNKTVIANNIVNNQ